MIEKTLAEEISKREFQVVNRDKVIKHLQETSKARGEEIIRLKELNKILLKALENLVDFYHQKIEQTHPGQFVNEAIKAIAKAKTTIA